METLRHPVNPGISSLKDDTHRGNLENLETSLTQAHTSISQMGDVESDSDEEIVIFQGRSQELQVSNTGF
jgi:hypothetical protein